MYIELIIRGLEDLIRFIIAECNHDNKYFTNDTGSSTNECREAHEEHMRMKVLTS